MSDVSQPSKENNFSFEPRTSPTNFTLAMDRSEHWVKAKDVGFELSVVLSNLIHKHLKCCIE